MTDPVATLDILCGRFPGAFNCTPQPLKLGCGRAPLTINERHPAGIRPINTDKEK